MLWSVQLSAAVEVWEPRSETVALHAWVHPWLPMLGDRLTDQYPGIRHKLSVALQQWHPSDSTVHNLLSPWHTVSRTSERAGSTSDTPARLGAKR